MSHHLRPEAMRYALRAALTLALLIAGASHAPARRLDGMMMELPAGNPDKAVALVEAAVAKAPQDAKLRAALGQAYLRAGRFAAAASALDDASALGDSSGHTRLSLALAQIAGGQNRAALATLDHGAATIAPTERGLALALAGDAESGIAILTDSVRDGSATPTSRQNLAYAYALGGRWADARLTAGLDLSPDQVDGRFQQWARSMQYGGERVRIAQLLNVPVSADPGMPAALALSGAGAPPVAKLASARTDASGELVAVSPPAPNNENADAAARRFAFRP